MSLTSRSKIFVLGLLAFVLSVNISFAQQNPFSTLQQLGPGFYGILLPFIFTFAVIYGLLLNVSAFKEGVGQRAAVVVAFVAGLFVTSIGGPQLAAFFITLFGGASIIIAGILVVVLLLVLVGWGGAIDKTNTVVMAVVILIGIVLFLNATGTFPIFTINPQLANIIFVFLVLVAVAWFLYHKPEEKTKTGGGTGQQPQIR